MRQVHVNDQYATCHRAWGETYVLTSFIVCRVGWLGIPECENLALMRISIRAPAFKASLLLNAWLLGALFWQAHYLCNLRRPGRRAPGQATKSADRHDAVQVVVVQQNGSTQSSAAVQDGGWHANVTNGVVAMDGANNISTLIAVADCREKQNSFCNLHGVNYTCVLFPGSSQTKRRDRAPSPNCLDGEYSWNVCSAGKFLCKTAWVPDCSDQQSTLMPALCETYSANVSHSTCVLSSGSVKLSRDDRTIPQACLNGIYHWGVCMNGKILCSASTTRMLPNLLEQDSAHNAEQEYLSWIRREVQNMRRTAAASPAGPSHPHAQPKTSTRWNAWERRRRAPGRTMTSHHNETGDEPTTKTVMYVVSLQGTPGASSTNMKRLDQFRSRWQDACGEMESAKVLFKHCPGIVNADAHGWKNRHAVLKKQGIGYGTTQAFIHCFELAMQDDQGMSVFFEDDAQLERPEFCSPEFRDDLWRAAPSDSLLLLLGGQNWEFGSRFPVTGNSPETLPDKVGQFFWSTYSFGAYAFAVPRRNLRALQHWFVRDIVEGQRGMRIQLSPDVSWYDLARATKSRVYAKDPLLFGHAKGYSNTWNTDKAPWNIHDIPAGPLDPFIRRQMIAAEAKRNESSYDRLPAPAPTSSDELPNIRSTSDHLQALTSCQWNGDCFPTGTATDCTSCRLNGIDYTCERVLGSPQTHRNDPAPSTRCLPGPYSWGVCSEGGFLCTVVPGDRWGNRSQDPPSLPKVRDALKWDQFAARHGCALESTSVIYCF